MNKDNIKAKIIADSINPQGVRLTSWELEYPRYLHSEWMTHRVFSRNSASSRAIPYQTIRQQVLDEMVEPVLYTSESGKIGMQGGTELGAHKIEGIRAESRAARTHAVQCADRAMELGAHRSIINRWIEPWMTIKIVATATNHHNLFALRCHKAALPDFQVLAWRMLSRYTASTPSEVPLGGWHIPYMDLMPTGLTQEQQIKVATARCCWVSYNRPDKTGFDLEDAFKRHDDCAKLGHFSPLEHIAKAVNPAAWSHAEPEKHFTNGYPWSNFDVNGVPSYWAQYRKLFIGECGDKHTVSLPLLMSQKPDWITV